MSGSESAKPEDLRMRTAKLWDYVKGYLVSRVDDNEAAIESLEARVGVVEEDLADTRQRLDALGGLAEDERSTPAQRKLDLQDAMIKAAQESDAGAVRWWKDDVRDALAGRGHENLHKPELYTAMNAVAEEVGFEETTKRVTKETAGGHERTYEVDAIRVDTDDLPGGASR